MPETAVNNALQVSAAGDQWYWNNYVWPRQYPWATTQYISSTPTINSIGTLLDGYMSLSDKDKKIFESILKSL